MSKKFFDVFPTLHLNRETTRLFEDADILKVATNTNRDHLFVQLHSYHLIAKKDIYMVENAIKEQLFAKNPIDIRIRESFELSKQYTPENLMREYRDSILLELKKRSVLEYNMFLNAKYHFEDGHILCLEFEHTSFLEF